MESPKGRPAKRRRYTVWYPSMPTYCQGSEQRTHHVVLAGWQMIGRWCRPCADDVMADLHATLRGLPVDAADGPAA